ncbi:MAG: energy coupling factor transporter S component ThiW [Psychrobacillus psychrotolerans]|uniref:energy coupling factor transporter S component ThiW n=1 Tax=Psychrobacillus psychrotolerans TaxID=126156 RepID=UPI003BAFB5AC
MKSQKLVLMAMFVSIGVLGSAFIWFPAGIAKAYPIQHAINVLSAVFLGPIGAVGVALMTAVIRIFTGTGSLLAIPGGIIGALLAGVLYKITGRVGMAVVGEIVGTGFLASLVAVPYAKVFMGTEFGAWFFVPAFFASSLSGALIAWIIAKRIERSSIRLVDHSLK